MRLLFTYFVFFLMLMDICSGQSLVKTDTSYTPYSAFQKYSKKYPDIVLVKPLQDKDLKEIKGIVYQQRKDHDLTLELIRENSDRILPAVLLVHGGGWRTGAPILLKPLAQQLALKGYACFLLEYRLSTEAQYPAAVFDTKSAIRYIRSHAIEYHIASNKIAIVGSSAGGQIAALVGTTNNNPNFEDVPQKIKESSAVQSIVDIDGILAFHHPESEESTSASLWLGGTYEEVPQNWIQASALTHVDKNTPPILFLNSKFNRFHGGRDDMIKVLNENVIYSEVHTFEDAPHSFWLFEPWFTPTVIYITDFLNKTLK